MLRPLEEHETAEYIYSRLVKAGMPQPAVFPQPLLGEIHARSQGIPRLVNGICDNLLLTAFAMESKTVTLEMLEEVTDDMRLEWPGRRMRGPRRVATDSYAAARYLGREG
jgi:general secretion pathway protein A